MKPEIQILESPAALFRSAAQCFVGLAQNAVRERGVFFAALSGGSTPKGMFDLLAGDAGLCTVIPWSQTHFFWSDERCVPPDDPASNYHLANESLLSRVPVPASNIHRVQTELPEPRQAAAEYELTLRRVFQVREDQVPRFDLVMLGLGADGHTASLFPGTEALCEQHRWVAANWVGNLNRWRITFTLPLINHAACVTFLVSGSDKAAILRQVLQEQTSEQPLPAQLVQPIQGKLLWFVDQPAAKALSATSA